MGKCNRMPSIFLGRNCSYIACVATYLWPREFVIHFDHKSLKYVKGQNIRISSNISKIMIIW